MKRILLFILAIIGIILLSIGHGLAQAQPCTVGNGASLNGLSSFLGGNASWSESMPPVRLQAGETITLTFTGGGAIRLRWFAFPVNPALPLLDSGILNTPQSVAFVAPSTGNYNYAFDLTANTTVTFSCVLPGGGGGGGGGGSAPGFAPDDRLNFEHGDLMDVVYRRTDAQGNPALHVYVVGPNGGNFLCMVSRADAAPYVGNPPPQNVFIRQCNAQVSIYYLTSDELQMNIGPDSQGKTYVLVFDNYSLQVTHRYSFGG